MPRAAATLRAPTRVDRERQPWGSLAVLSLNLFVLRLFLTVPIVRRPRWARSHPGPCSLPQAPHRPPGSRPAGPPALGAGAPGREPQAHVVSSLPPTSAHDLRPLVRGQLPRPCRFLTPGSALAATAPRRLALQAHPQAAPPVSPSPVSGPRPRATSQWFVGGTGVFEVCRLGQWEAGGGAGGTRLDHVLRGVAACLSTGVT